MLAPEGVPSTPKEDAFESANGFSGTAKASRAAGGDIPPGIENARRGVPSPPRALGPPSRAAKLPHCRPARDPSMCITVSYMFYHVYHHPAINIEDLFCVSPACRQHRRFILRITILPSTSKVYLDNCVLIPLVGVPGLAKDYQLLDLGCAANYNFKCSAHRRRAP